MAANERWYFTREQLDNTPSRKCGFDADKELSYRQQAANFIQDMGQRLLVTQLCINTAIVYMHRFYVYHSFTNFHRNAIAAASLFLAAKIEEQPRRLEHVIRVANLCLHREQLLDTKSAAYLEQAQDLVFNEDVLLQTLGFEVAIDHPHTHVVRCCDLVGASKELARASYFMASNSLHLTTMCLQYKPTVVACFCIHLACKWSNWQIPLSKDGKEWYSYVDKSVTLSQLEELTEEFLITYEKCPAKLKNRIKSIGSTDASENQTKEPVTENPLNTKRRRTKTSGSESEQVDGSSASRKLLLNIPSTSNMASCSGTDTVKASLSELNVLSKPSSSNLIIPASYFKKTSISLQHIPLPSAKPNDSHHQRKQNGHNKMNSPELTTATKRCKLDNHGKKN